MGRLTPASRKKNATRGNLARLVGKYGGRAVKIAVILTL